MGKDAVRLSDAIRYNSHQALLWHDTLEGYISYRHLKPAYMMLGW
jgi:hypothetical protein